MAGKGNKPLVVEVVIVGEGQDMTAGIKVGDPVIGNVVCQTVSQVLIAGVYQEINRIGA